MPYNSVLHIVYYSVSITISILVSFLFWERRSSTGAKALALMLIFGAEWSLTEILSDLSTSLFMKIFWSRMSFIGVVVIPIFMLHFTLQYTRREHIFTLRNKVFLSIIPLITIILVWTNDFHHLFMANENIEVVGILKIISPEYHGWFWVHAVYSYSIILLSTYLLIKKLVHLPQIFRKQAITMILATMIPLLGSILYTVGVLPTGSVDPTALSFTFSGILFFFGMFRYKLFDLIPKARGAVIETMSELVIVLDKHNRIIDINKSAQKLFGKETEDLIGADIFHLIGDSVSQVMDAVELLKSNDKVNITYGSPKRCYEMRMSQLYDSSSKFSGRFVIMHDITDLKEAMEKMEKSRKAAEEANKAKSQFLATMSHEIRTPLNGIIGMAEMLSSAKLSEDEKQFLNSIQLSADSLLDVINDILDFSKIEAGKMDLENTSFNLKNLVDTIFKTFSYKAEEKGLNLSYHIAEEVPENLVGDPIKIKQILVNLLGNSMKFTFNGTIALKVDKLKNLDDQAVLRFSVSDTGIGIPKGKINTLFNSFQQLDGSTTRKFGGTGLGLAIVKRLVALMGGTMDVQSKLGEGSTFSFEIAFQISESIENKEDKAKEVTDFSLENVKILLVEDNNVNQMFMLKLLEKYNSQVDLADNGKVALEKCKNNIYDIILMDLQMPEMDGYEATAAIKGLDSYCQKHIPIIALTANVTEEDKIKCIRCGMDDYLSKPVKSNILLMCIKKHLLVNRRLINI